METPLADTVCNLRVNVHCDWCKMSLTDVIQSIRGVYSVSIDMRGRHMGIARVVGEVDPSMLLRAIFQSGGHAELLNMTVQHPRLRNNNRYQNNDNDGYGSLGYRSSGSLSNSAYYELDHHRDLHRPVIEYPYSYSENYVDNRPHVLPSYPSLQYGNYEYGPLPRAVHVPSNPPPQYDQYGGYIDPDSSISFCSIM